MNKMKVVAGLAALDDYPDFCRALADEVFFGYLPGGWLDRFSLSAPVNRREVLYANVQIGSESELEILKDMTEDYQVPGVITFNKPAYSEAERGYLLKLVGELMEMGFQDYIIADLKLIRLLSDAYKGEALRPGIHVSGELGELNSGSISLLKELGVKRIIFPRQTRPEEMKKLISHCPELEYEAFFLNEKCHYTGAYCNSWHSDRFCHMCRQDYRLSPKKAGHDVRVADGGAGITHLKLVSRGNDSQTSLKDLKTIQIALEVLEAAEEEVAYISRMKDLLFPEGCSGNCYY